MQNVSIVHMTETRLDRVLEIERLCFSDPWTRDAFTSGFDSGFQKYFSAEVDGRVVGYVGIAYIFEEGEILNIAVAPEAQRKGVGQALLDYALDYFKNHGVDRATLEVRSSNDRAQNFYRKNGFKPFAVRKKYYSRPLEDGIIMEKYL